MDNDPQTPHEPAAIPTPEPISTPYVSTTSSQTTLFASLAFAVILLVFVFLARRKSSKRGNAVLLVGPCDAGKTAILSTLVYKQTLPTHTSLQTNSSVIALGPPNSQKTVQVVDIPGHPRIRDQFKEYLAQAKAVVFVVDASTVSRNGPAVAEHLHRVLQALTSLPPSQQPPSLLILAHKSDLLKSTTSTTNSEQLAINRVRTILERELEKRKASQVGGVGMEGLGEDSMEGQGGEVDGLECSGGVGFRFKDWEGGEVGFVGSYVRVGRVAEVKEDGEKGEEGESGLEALEEWLDELA
ncbi:hypothetical protein JAAARDRAFT_570856 [Jaapia argillacea MUCL 33604]|uniref:Signal recognition particle receptor subunit beta n=1 Tax=Jaapia argillacea MUCL 33604 TaxID=933084 RepID=A0A067QC25_9AGAM|nr:hypothetical protein JAAARDRAFT_570856 [Jaapia argillacea MUCL 33604]